MPSTSSVSPSGDKYIDAILAGTKWANPSLTYSFPSSASYYGSGYGGGEPGSNFAAFNAAQQAAVKSIYAMYSSVANVTFTEVTETSTQHATLRFAETDKYTTGFGYYPHTSAEGGDAWFGNSSNYFNNPAKGNYAYFTLIHEIGHTLGLKHAFETMGSFGAIPSDRDSTEYTVMTYRSYVGASTAYYTNGGWSYPQTLMMYDIAAVQKLYGANYQTNSTDTVYQWDPNTGELFVNGAGQGAPGANQVYMTLWDGGGSDTYDFSNYATGLAVSLEPGGWTVTSGQQLASLGNGHLAAGNIANALLYQANPASLIENVIGGSGSDTLTGNVANNVFRGGGGNDFIDGHGGSDTAVYAGNKTDYRYEQQVDGSWTVADLRGGSPDGVDTLKNVEFLQFKDTTADLGLSSDQHPGFDPEYYLAINPDVKAAGIDPYTHFIEIGWKEGLDPNAVFSTKGYLDTNSDVAAAGINPLTHFEQYGWKEGRDPSPNFDVRLYLMHNPNVAAAGMNPLNHYLAYGDAQGSTIYDAIGSPNAVGFDAEYYLFQNPDVAAAQMDPYQHYLEYGWREGRDPNAYFDTSAYLAANPDVAAAGVNPLIHYNEYGWKEGRDLSSGTFDGVAYLAANPDVAAAHMNPLVHFEQYGIYEGRDPLGGGGTGDAGGQPDPQLLGEADWVDGAGSTDTASSAASSDGASVSLATGVDGGGDAELSGGSGAVTLSYARAASDGSGVGVTVDLSTTETETSSGFENLTGSEFNDTLRGNSGDNIIAGLGGNDTITGAGGTTPSCSPPASGTIPSPISLPALIPSPTT